MFLLVHPSDSLSLPTKCNQQLHKRLGDNLRKKKETHNRLKMIAFEQTAKKKRVDKFLYLGTWFQEKTDQSIEIEMGIGEAKSTFMRMQNIFTR